MQRKIAATGEATLIGRRCRNDSISPIGSVAGLARALCDGLVGGLVFVWLHNFIVGWGRVHDR